MPQCHCRTSKTSCRTFSKGIYIGGSIKKQINAAPNTFHRNGVIFDAADYVVIATLFDDTRGTTLNEYTIDFMSPDPDYIIATSFYRDEIEFLVNITGMGNYFVSMQTLTRTRQNIQGRVGKINNYPSAECERGLILVNYLDMDSLNNAVLAALSQGFFGQQKTTHDLPLGGDSSAMSINREQHTTYHTTGKMKANKTEHLELGSPKVTQATVQPEFLGFPVEHMSVTVEVGNRMQYTLTLMSPEAVSEYFHFNAPTMCLSVPGLVVVEGLESADLEDIVRWCHQRYYFETLRPVRLSF